MLCFQYKAKPSIGLSIANIAACKACKPCCKMLTSPSCACRGRVRAFYPDVCHGITSQPHSKPLLRYWLACCNAHQGQFCHDPVCIYHGITSQPHLEPLCGHCFACCIAHQGQLCDSLLSASAHGVTAQPHSESHVCRLLACCNAHQVTLVMMPMLHGPDHYCTDSQSLVDHWLASCIPLKNVLQALMSCSCMHPA